MNNTILCKYIFHKQFRILKRWWWDLYMCGICSTFLLESRYSSLLFCITKILTKPWSNFGLLLFFVRIYILLDLLKSYKYTLYIFFINISTAIAGWICNNDQYCIYTSIFHVNFYTGHLSNCFNACVEQDYLTFIPGKHS